MKCQWCSTEKEDEAANYNHGLNKYLYGTNRGIKVSSIKFRQNGTTSLFYRFYANESFEVGIIRILTGQKDIQNTHSSDEFYFVVDGNGKIKISHKDHAINKGSCIFVPANTNHYFHSNEVDLIVLYVFKS